MEKQRILYLDALRVVAMFAVIMLHVSIVYCYNYEVTSNVWKNCLFWYSISSWGVPVFVLISGSLFLNPNKKISLRSLYSKNIKRIVILLINWSIVYSLYKILSGKVDCNVGRFITGFIRGYYHLWFLYMIIGLYAITPLLRKITENVKYMKYFVGLSIVFSFIIPTVKYLGNSFSLLTGNEKITEMTNFVFEQFHFHFTLEHAAYFVLGYYLTTINLSKKYRYFIYLMGLIATGFIYLYSLFVSLKTGNSWNIFDNMSLFMFLISMSVFIFVKYSLKDRNTFEGLIKMISKYSLGIYLIHALILSLAADSQIFAVIYDKSFLSVPFLSICVFLISLLSVIVLNKIPLINKLLL